MKTKKIQIILKYKKQIIAIILIIVLLPYSLEPFQNNLRIYFIDVGQGDACLLITPKGTKVLIDGGGSESYDVRRKYATSISIK